MLAMITLKWGSASYPIGHRVSTALVSRGVGDRRTKDGGDLGGVLLGAENSICAGISMIITESSNTHGLLLPQFPHFDLSPCVSRLHSGQQLATFHLNRVNELKGKDFIRFRRKPHWKEQLDGQPTFQTCFNEKTNRFSLASKRQAVCSRCRRRGSGVRARYPYYHYRGIGKRVEQHFDDAFLFFQ